MGKITLNEALKKASVKNDLQMFLGLDAQSELGGMTPERLAAVAGEKIWKVYTNSNPNKLDLSKELKSGLYAITNLRSATINPPIESNAACIVLSNPISEVLIAADAPFIYGRFKDGSCEWKKLF